MDSFALLEKIVAGLALAVCLGLLVRLAIGPERIARLLRWRAAKRGAGSSDGDWDGNVYRPKNFRRPKKPH